MENYHQNPMGGLSSFDIKLFRRRQSISLPAKLHEILDLNLISNTNNINRFYRDVK